MVAPPAAKAAFGLIPEEPAGAVSRSSTCVSSFMA